MSENNEKNQVNCVYKYKISPADDIYLKSSYFIKNGDKMPPKVLYEIITKEEFESITAKHGVGHEYVELSVV